MKTGAVHWEVIEIIEPLATYQEGRRLTDLEVLDKYGQAALWTCPICGGKTSDEYISCDFCGENSIPKEPKHA